MNLSLANLSPLFGDPTIVGWVITTAYAISALLALLISINANHYYHPHTVNIQKWFWIIIALCMLFLCLNKQLDLQTTLTRIGKSYAKNQGWYQYRRAIQAGFILSLLILFSTFFFINFEKIKEIFKSNWVAFMGFFIILLYVFGRALYFYHLSERLNLQIFQSEKSWIIELVGISFLISSAGSIIYKARRS